jgi:hypothetical protein
MAWYVAFVPGPTKRNRAISHQQKGGKASIVHIDCRQCYRLIDENTLAMPKRKSPPSPSKVGTLFMFGFGLKKKRGRPRKRESPGTVDDVVMTAPQTNKETPATRPKLKEADSPPIKNKRTNYSKGSLLKRLTQAVHDWDKVTGNRLDSNGEAVGIDMFASIVGIPRKTLEKYVHEDRNKRRKLGFFVGRAPALNEKDSNFAADVLCRADRGNEGYTRKEAVDMIQDLKPRMNRKQASRSLTMHVIHSHPDVLKQKVVKAQSTTTKQTAITVPQQWRWHTHMDSVFDELRHHNTGNCRCCGKLFGEVIEHSIIGGD